MAAALYYDLGSPYSYLAVARCERVLGPVTLQPVLVGAIFGHRGWGSWGVTDERDSHVAEVERRAARGRRCRRPRSRRRRARDRRARDQGRAARGDRARDRGRRAGGPDDGRRR